LPFKQSGEVKEIKTMIAASILPIFPLRQRPARRSRRGVALVVLAVCLLVLLAFLALAIDLGMLALAQTQVSDAADAAALAAARALNGNTESDADNNYAAATPAAQAVVASNKVLGTALTSSQVNVKIGCYTYSYTNKRFEGQFTRPASDNWNMAQATVTANVSSAMGFSKAVGFSVPNLSSTATAAHRPRDICMILDYSGSMRFASLLGLDYYDPRDSSNNLDPVYPKFGHYSSSSAAMSGGSTSGTNKPAANITATTSGRPPIVLDFYADSSGTQAFTAAPSSYANTPGGDCPLKSTKNTSSTYAATVKDIVGSTSYNSDFETKGYAAYGVTYNGYTQGPGYYGKTFFIWPPNPVDKVNTSRVADWRKRFFKYPGSSTRMDDNTKLFLTSGSFKGSLATPSSSTYTIDYDAILAWIKEAPCPFPSRLQAGRIVYYDSIPSTINVSTYPPSDTNQRFWKDYIDYVLGFQGTGVGAYKAYITASNGTSTPFAYYTGYGDDFTYVSTPVINSKPSGSNPNCYMNYLDNPRRPRLRFWFGPITMIDFLGNYNLWSDCNYTRYCWWPGTCHESPLYACKLGIRAALLDIKKNHPNDMVSLIMFSHPKSSASDNSSGGRFNRVRVPLSRDYSSMLEALWYPPETIGNSSATVIPYDSDNLEVPRAMGGTCYAYALMLAYNQFSSNTSLQTYNSTKAIGDAGGNGRKGAQKIVIFETDGAPTFYTTSLSLSNKVPNQAYYPIRYNSASPSTSEYPSSVTNVGSASSAVTTQIYTVCQQLAALESAYGYSGSSRPLLLHCIAFGPQGTDGLAILKQMQTYGNINDGMPSYKIIDGSESTVISNLQTTIEKILQDGVQVSLIQ
jgi:Flp pilus assembly protein TadG